MGRSRDVVDEAHYRRKRQTIIKLYKYSHSLPVVVDVVVVVCKNVSIKNILCLFPSTKFSDRMSSDIFGWIIN